MLNSRVWREHTAGCIWSRSHVVCRETEKEAKDYLHHYVYERGDWKRRAICRASLQCNLNPDDPNTLEDHKAHSIAGHWGGYPLVGTPNQDR